MRLPHKLVAATSFAAILAAVALPVPASALDDTQKREIGAFIKEYLIENPEIMLDVQDALQQKQASARAQVAQKAVAENQDTIFSSKFDLSLGNPNGDVTIVEFFDYNCGYCKHALADMDTILAKDKNVRFVLKEFPILGPESLAAHKVSDAFRKIAPEKYGEFHRALLGTEGRANEESAIAVATSLGVSEADIRKTMEENPNDEAVQEAYQLANSLGISGTPSYVMGNEAIFGAVGADSIEEKITNMRSCGKTSC
ncbi:DsbA family protein [Rhizobiaceae bacterium n13]|uniref:DsbA family protein n=1 Tax=Ferirhizobium litorale TaxID=2927786 RepID=A0AAE3U5P0_9HYPH|nr:DsbA family protein [Fererhizobium litorale]MDI7864413.1 DsbA family protein [Fererhizobium litorale]MDI7924673.1 DsbA family protein [Fererhizobium litorale]